MSLPTAFVPSCIPLLFEHTSTCQETSHFQMLDSESKENQHPQKEGRDQEQDQQVAKDEKPKGKSALSLTRNSTTVATQSQNQNSTFHRSCQIELRQPVGSMSLSPGQ